MRSRTKTSGRATSVQVQGPSIPTGFRRKWRARRLGLVAALRQRVHELERENRELRLKLALPYDRKARRRLDRVVRKAVLAEARRREASGG